MVIAIKTACSINTKYSYGMGMTMAMAMCKTVHIVANICASIQNINYHFLNERYRAQCGSNITTYYVPCTVIDCYQPN